MQRQAAETSRNLRFGAMLVNMASSTLIPVGEYLNTIYRPNRDYIDGEVKERNLGLQPHPHLQAILAGIFRDLRKEWFVAR